MSQLDNQVGQQVVGTIVNGLNKIESKQEKTFDATKHFAKQQAMKPVNKKIIDPAKKKANEKIVDPAKQTIKENVVKPGKEVVKKTLKNTMDKAKKQMAAMSKTRKGFGVDRGPLTNPVEKTSEVSMKSSRFFAGKDVASSLASKTATKVATKGVATALAAPTAGMSVVAEQAVSTAQTVGGVASKTGKVKAVADIVKLQETSAKDMMADKANHIVQGQATKIMSTVAPGVDKMQGLVSKANEKKDDKNKDTSVAIFSGTKDMMGKAGITKDFGLGK